MFSLTTLSRLFVLALFALSTAVGAEGTDAKGSAETKAPADSKAAAASKVTDAKTAALKEKARKATSVAEFKKLIEEMSKERDLLIKDFEDLTKQMKDATEEQKKEIREKLEAQKKHFEEVTSALHKQIRDEQRKQRQNASPGKR